MDDRDIVAAIVAGDADGIAYAYDKYADSLYGYCHSAALEPSHAAVAVQDTFIIAAARLGALRDPRKLRPWLYAVARGQRRPPRSARPLPADAPAQDAPAQDPPAQDAPAQDPPAQDALPPDALSPETAAPEADAPADDTTELSAEAELRHLASNALNGLHASEREIIELNLGHYLAGSDLAAVLGVSRSQAHALVSRVRARLERSLAAPLAAHAGSRDCPALDTLLPDGDGRLTALARKRIARHLGQCETCARRMRAELDDVVRSALDRLPALPPALREEVLRLSAKSAETAESAAAPADEAYREWVIQRAGQFGPAGFPRPVRQPRRIFTVTGAAAAAAVLVAAASTGIVTVLTLGNSHVPRSVDTAHTSRGSVIASPGATGNVVATRSATTTRSAAATGTVPAGALPPVIMPTISSPSPSARATPSSSSRPKPVPSPSGSAQPTAAPSPSPSVSPTPTPTPTPTPPLPPASPGGQWPPPPTPPATGMP